MLCRAFRAGGYSLAGAARELGVSAVLLHKVKAGDMAVSLRVAVAAEARFGDLLPMSAEDLVLMQARYDLWRYRQNRLNEPAKHLRQPSDSKEVGQAVAA